jgi:hypothetical protein
MEGASSSITRIFIFCLLVYIFFDDPLRYQILVSKAKGNAVVQAVSRWLPTSAACVQDRVKLCGICGGQSGAGAGFL